MINQMNFENVDIDALELVSIQNLLGIDLLDHQNPLE